jgi:hypothetical protein
MLEQGKADLSAGGAAFPFTLSKGFAGFDTPATFLKFNRAILARVLVNRGTQGCGAPCFTQALTAIGESFATAPGAATSLAQLNAGVYNNYSTATGDVQNSLSTANNGNLFAHASIVTDAQKQADGTTLDDRVGRKVVKLANPVSPPQGTGIPANYAFTIYATPSTDVPIIRNEELISSAPKRTSSSTTLRLRWSTSTRSARSRASSRAGFVRHAGAGDHGIALQPPLLAAARRAAHGTTPVATTF